MFRPFADAWQRCAAAEGFVFVVVCWNEEREVPTFATDEYGRNLGIRARNRIVVRGNHYRMSLS